MNYSILNFLEGTRHNHEKILGILNCCHLPIRRFPSKSLPPHILKNINCKSSSQFSHHISKLPSLSNLVSKNVTSETEFMKINEHKNFLKKVLAKQCQKKNDQIELKSSPHEKIMKSDFNFRYKLNKSKRRNYKCQHAIMKIISERGNLCGKYKGSKSQMNTNNNETSNLMNTQSISSKFTQVTSVKVSEPLVGREFLQSFFGNSTLNKNEIEDTMYGIEENLESNSKINEHSESNSQSIQDNNKSGISSISHYVTAKSEYISSFNKNQNNSMNKTNQKNYVSVYEKEFQKLHILYPNIQNLVDGSYKILQLVPEDRVNPFIMANKFYSQSIYISHSKPSSRKSDKFHFILKQSNNNNNDDEEKHFIDNHQYFRRAQQLLSNNSSQMQYLIYGFDKTNNDLKEKEMTNKFDIAVFKDGERMEPVENLDNLKSKLFKNSQKSKMEYNEIENNKFSNLNIDAVLSCSNDKKNKRIGPALQSYLERRQRCRIEAQEKDHNLMLSRARMIKCDHLKSEFDTNDHCDLPEKVGHSPYGVNVLKTKPTTNYKEQNQQLNEKCKRFLAVSSSGSEDENSTLDKNKDIVQSYSENRNDSVEDSHKSKRCQNLNKNYENVSPVSKQEYEAYIREHANEADLNSLSSNNCTDEKIYQILNEDICQSSNNNESKHVTFHENDIIISTNKCNENPTDKFENTTRNEKKFVYPIDSSTFLTKLSYMEQQISILTIMLSNILHKINDLDINFQEFSKASMKHHIESFDHRQRNEVHSGTSYYENNYRNINNSMYKGMSSILH